MEKAATENLLAGINKATTLLIGIGNCGRADDGLGWAFLDNIQQQGNFKGKIIYRYQLQPEDAELISRYEQVIFIDACRDALPEGFSCKPCYENGNFAFTSHILKPEAVLFLCEELYSPHPASVKLMIAGTDWGLKKGLSEHAVRNLEKAVSWFEELLCR